MLQIMGKRRHVDSDRPEIGIHQLVMIVQFMRKDQMRLNCVRIFLAGCLLGMLLVNTCRSLAQEPRWFAYRCPYGVFERHTLEHFARMGVEVVHISPLNTLSSLGVPYSPFGPSWVGPQRYEFTPVDQYIESVLAVHPSAKIICGVDLNTPGWWPRLLGTMRRVDSFCELGRIAASTEWREETREYLQAFLRHTESRWSEVIVGYTLFGGMTLEWQDQSLGQESPSKRTAWRQWMVAQGFTDPGDIPPMSLRERASRGFFRDPDEDRLVVDYWRFSNWLIGDTILYFASAAQEVLQRRVPLGTFYGYLWEHAVPGRMPYEGHLDFDRVWASADLNFFMAPASYFDRAVGGAGGYMLCVDSLHLHGKGYVHEVDHRTPSARSVTILGRAVPGHESGFPDDEAAVAGLRREFVRALIGGHSLWWFNLFGRWFESETILQAIVQMYELWNRWVPEPASSAAEVVVLADSESMFYVNGRAPELSEFLFLQRFGLGRMGAPYEVYSFADVPRLDFSRYKLVILPNLFVINRKKRQWLEERICKDGRTVLWVYAPGIISEDKYSERNVEELTGIPFGTEGLTIRVMGDWRSVYCPKPNVPPELLRRVAKEAGVHIYSETDEPLWVNRRFLGFHTATGGNRRFRLPRKVAKITELFAGKVVAGETDEFEVVLPAPATVLFLIDETTPDSHRNSL